VSRGRRDNQPSWNQPLLTPMIASGRSYGRGHDPSLLEIWPSAEDNLVRSLNRRRPTTARNYRATTTVP
jgi:hypothetical protein